jgi:hypothetical protein
VRPSDHGTSPARDRTKGHGKKGSPNNIVPIEFEEERLREKWHRRYQQATDDWVRKNPGKGVYLPRKETADAILRFAEDERINLPQAKLNKLRRISSLLGFAASLLVLQETWATIRDAEAAMGDPANPCRAFTAELAKQVKRIEDGKGCDGDWLRTHGYRCIARLEEVSDRLGEWGKAFRTHGAEAMRRQIQDLEFECTRVNGALAAQKSCGVRKPPAKGTK